MRTPIRLVVVALLGAAAALLVSCGSSGAGLIPAANAGPLQADFEAVAQAAESGNGNCAETESALGKTEQDFLELPASVDKGLHARLQLGIANLRKRALAMCIQPTVTDTTSTPTNTTTTQSPTTSTPTNAPTTPSPTTSTPTPPTTPGGGTPQSPGGGVEAPGEVHAEESPSGGVGKEGEANGGANAGGANPGGAQ